MTWRTELPHTTALRRARGVALALVLAAALTPSRAPAQPPSTRGTRLVLLGTAGGPAIKKARAQPANALIVNGAVYIIDTSDGVSRQTALADISPIALRAVFITHLHSDHVADYGTLLLRVAEWPQKTRRYVWSRAPGRDDAELFALYAVGY